MARIMTVRAPDDLFKDLERLAKTKGFTRNGLILQILWEWVKKNEQNKAG